MKTQGGPFWEGLPSTQRGMEARGAGQGGANEQGRGQGPMSMVGWAKEQGAGPDSRVGGANA